MTISEQECTVLTTLYLASAKNTDGVRCVGVIPHKEPYFLPPICRFGHGEVQVGINSMPRFEIDVHITQNHRFHAQAL
jgi:hypothetical protein